MANHLRRQIRERVGTTLTGLSTTGSNVFQTRLYPLEDDNLPCLCIYTLEETAEIDAMGSTRAVNRTLSLAIEGHASATSNIDDTIDQISKEVEIAMAGDIKINNLAHDSYLESVDISLSKDGTSPQGVIRLMYSVIYRNAENAPDVAI